jgi:patatin-like phospholipase/acyl hydrolase
MLTPKYSAYGMEKVFKDVAKTYRLTDVLNNIIVSTYDLTNNKPLFFKSLVARNNNAQNALLYDVCRATSAGPTYLPSYQFNYPDPDGNDKPNRNCIDGGVFVNNPSLAALSEFSKHFKEYLPQLANQKDIDYANVYVLSIGTGSYKQQISQADSEYKGELFWAQNIPTIMMRGVNDVTHYQMTEMMEPQNYLRLDIDIDSEQHSDMDNSSSETMQYLIKATNDQLINNAAKMNDLTALLNKMNQLNVSPKI